MRRIACILLLTTTLGAQQSTPDLRQAIAAFEKYASEHTAHYQAWLAGNGLDKVITARTITATPPLLPPEPSTAFTLHLTLNGAANVTHNLAHTFWQTMRDQYSNTYHTDLEERLLLRFAHELNIPANQAHITLNRYDHDDCWIITLGITETGYETHETLCTSATATTTINPAILTPLITKVGTATGQPQAITTLTPQHATKKNCMTLPSKKGPPRIVCDVSEYTILPAEQLKETLDRLESRLRATYHDAHYQATTKAGALREATIDRVKNRVLDGPWERHQVSLIAAPDGTNLQIMLIIDGQYAPGIGNHPPDLDSYRDMEPHYSSALATYTKALLVTLTTP